MKVRRTRAAKLVLHVAFMSRGTAGRDWESLKRKKNCCDMTQHGPGDHRNLSC
jgi:hypothetical protein